MMSGTAMPVGVCKETESEYRRSYRGGGQVHNNKSGKHSKVILLI